MSEGTVHPLAQPVGRTHASGVFDWYAVPSADPRASAFALDTAPALPAAAEEFSGEACREIVEDLLDRTRTGAAVAEVHAPFCESKSTLVTWANCSNFSLASRSITTVVRV